jgi:glycosyltransferase involved in cell wall biosynthesis
VVGGPHNLNSDTHTSHEEKHLTNSNSTPKVSVVIPVYNGGGTISKTVEHLLRQSLSAHQIIIVDDGSTDDTVQILESFGDRIIPLSKENGGPASARNCGIVAATGEFVAFTDSDCLPDQDWLYSLIRGFDSPLVAGVGGVVRGAEHGLLNDYIDTIDLLNPRRNAAGEIQHLVTANACFRRSALVEAGLFNERFRKPGGEDTELSEKLHDLGYQLKTADNAVIIHYHKQTLRSFWKTICNYGEGAYLLGRIRPEYRWKGDIRKGLIASIIGAHLLVKKTLAYRAKHGLRRAVLFSFLEQLMSIAFSWGYMKAERKAQKT